MCVESHDWLGCWGHHMKSPGFKALAEHQKVPNWVSASRFNSAQWMTLTAGLLTLALAQPLSRNISDRQERPTLEKFVQDAKSLWQTRVWLFPSDLCPSSGYQAAPQGLGGLRIPAEMDHQTRMSQYQNTEYKNNERGRDFTHLPSFLKLDGWSRHRFERSDRYITGCSFSPLCKFSFSYSLRLPGE